MLIATQNPALGAGEFLLSWQLWSELRHWILGETLSLLLGAAPHLCFNQHASYSTCSENVPRSH